ncbi:molybdopterin-guanine dinucleotide biosynthesis protein MobB [uncultured Thiohalocapsa sp.]|uniref:molybdopterin-guanine dinucleotide biosynthesis protein MobB n=1 Tax=uncultured Thiohalocapsa sp. TaxID=768990 RepID=UPI0025DAACF5|nr:molybdopterin-guanine dinucleotide biosynthesis protein MobB [uncultured Thiohalocapsa sp.]
MGDIQSIDAWRSRVVEDSEKILAEVAPPQDPAPEARRIADGAAVAAAAPWAFSTRRVDRSAVTGLDKSSAPRAGDLVLARVDALGHHANLQLADGRRRRLFVDDHIVIAYGNRYACEQFEARVPQHLGPCHLVAGGGIAALALSWHDRISRGPTRISPLGLLTGPAGRPLNLGDFALEPRGHGAALPPVIAIVGTAMDAGKTQTAAYLVRGLRAAGYRTGYLKITGTGAGGDTWLLHDAGADRVLDFTDAGMASTYLAPLERIEAAMDTLLQDMADHGIDTVVMEVADGVYQRETRELIASARFAARVRGIVIAARDAMGASAAVTSLAATTIPVLALSGLLSASPLQRREAQQATGLSSANREELATAAVAAALRDQALAAGMQRAVGA